MFLGRTCRSALRPGFDPIATLCRKTCSGFGVVCRSALLSTYGHTRRSICFDTVAFALVRPLRFYH